MTEEEKEAIKYLEFLSKEKCECDACLYAKKQYKTLLNLIEKQQNKIASLEKQIKLMQNCDLEKVIEKQQKEIEREKQYTDFYKDLCDKQQKEIEEKTTILFAGAEKVKQLEKEIEELKERNKELEYEKILNEKIIHIANNNLDSYAEGYRAGLHKEITATEIVVQDREKFLFGQEIKRLKDTIYELHNKLDEGNKKVSRDYISKEKIREKIKELEEKIDRYSYYNRTTGFPYTTGKIEVLKELLEE